MSEGEVEVTEEVFDDEHEELENVPPEEEQTTVVESTASKLDASVVNVDSFDLLILDKETVDEVKRIWYGYIDGCSSREAAGAAMYAALFDSAPSLQSLFKTPRAVMAQRFMNGISNLINALDDPHKLKTLVETLGFQHLDLEVTVPRVVIFRDAIVELLVMELGSKMSTLGQNSLSALLSYVGGSYVYIRKNYAERIKIISKSWAIANNKKDDLLEAEEGNAEKDNPEGEDEMGFQQDKVEARASGERSSGEARSKNGMVAKVPTTFSEMFMFNSAVMGYGNDTWMLEVLESFDSIVTNVANSYRLQEECDVLSLRLAKCKGSINLPQFKSVMLASLRSLVPKDWNSSYEVAWGWLWENVERMLKSMLGRPAVMEQNLTRFLSSLDEDTQVKIRQMIYATFFESAPAGQDLFKQSATRLYFIADKVLEMTVELFRDPRRMCDDISAVGLRHVGYGSPTELFGPFVSSWIHVIRTLTQDEKLEDAFGWSMGLISRMTVRTILEGSTIVMKAINVNSGPQLRRAIGCAARSKRALWMLNITVGTQSISPLMWSIESSALEAADAIIKDLLTIRADRDCYYYAAEDLFTRHPDIVFQLCENARKINWTLLDGLLWRSRTTESGKRRVNYYVKYILVGDESKINSAMDWIVSLGDPKLICHPVLVFLADAVWNGAVYFTFVTCKAWLVFTLTCFLTAQSILSMWAWNQEGMSIGNATRQSQLALRLFVYVFCMGQLAIYHAKSTLEAYRQKATFKLYCLQIPEYLKNMQEWISLLQCLALVTMMVTCPKLYCIKHWAANDADFAVHGILNDFCEETNNIRVEYSICSVIVMLCFFLRMTDFCVMNNTISAYFIMVLRCLQEVVLFLVALGFVIFAFSASTLALYERNALFKDIPKAALSYLQMSFELADPTQYKLAEHTVLIFILLVLFQICIFVFLLNMLIAQLCSTHQSIYGDILGYARMQRIKTIYATIPYVPVNTWTKWIDSLMLDQKLEFGVGDIGLAGGMQVYEPANLNPTIIDTIRRVGGSTSPNVQWPEEEEVGENDGLARIEKVLTRIMQSLDRRSGKRSKGGASHMGASTTGDSAASGSQGGSVGGMGSE
jgi:hypothetical protein